MKVAVLFLAVALFGAFAAADDSTIAPFVCTSNAFVCKFKELGHHIKYHAGKLGSQLKEVGTNVLGAALDQGKNLLASAAQATLGTVLEHLNKEGIMGKREEVSFFGKIKEHLSNGAQLIQQAKEKLHGAFKAAVNKITGVMSGNAALTQVDEDADKKIDEAVAEYNKEGKKGFFGMAKAIAGKMGSIFKAGMEKLRERFGAKKVEERAILDSISAAWAKAKEHLSGLAGGIADTFRPHMDALKTGIAALGDKVKEHAGKLVDVAKGHFNTLKTKLSGHIDALKGHAATLGGHATNAVNALKEAVANIAMQAVGNAKDTLNAAVSTGLDAAKTVGDHVNGAISN